MRRSPRLEWLASLSEAATDECVLWSGALQGSGYGSVQHDGKHRGAHRVALIFATGEDPPHKHAAHRCGVPLCCNPRHLYWATPVQNCADRVLHGTHLQGERHPKAVLTEAQVLAIYHGTGSQRSTARQFGVPHATVGHIRSGRVWTWLTGHPAPSKNCGVDGCNSPSAAKGKCRRHYDRDRRHMIAEAQAS